MSNTKLNESDKITLNIINDDKDLRVSKIYHISDIHIHLQAKHVEYRLVFKRLYNILKEYQKIHEQNNEKSIIVITGDILHSKTELTPECIELTREFMKKLSKIMPTFFIAGNHDLNINNDERLDALTPIYNGIAKSYNLYYLDKTSLYVYGNIIFSVASVRDYNIINKSDIDNLISKDLKSKSDNYHIICLYHGKVNGAVLANGTSIEGEINNKTGTAITPSSFKDYDFTLMGDIHHKQFVNKNKTAGYSGSLIQQNHGETLTGHGILIWNLKDKTTTFREVDNNYGFITLKLIKSKLFVGDKVTETTTQANKQTNKQLSQSSKSTQSTKINLKNKEIGEVGLKIKEYYGKDDKNKDKSLPKNIRLRLLLVNTPYSFVHEFVNNIKKHHNITEFIYNDITDNTNNSSPNNKISTSETSNKISQNITNPQYQNKLIEEILNGMGQTDNTIERIKKMNVLLNEGIDRKDYSNHGQWSIKRLEFSNLYSYGLNNVINFTKCKGTVGIIADNYMGKSAILDIILYTLYDKFPRKGTLKDIINNRKNSFESKITFTIGEWDYVVSKSGRLTSAGKSTSKTDFYRIKGNIKEPLAEDNSPKTKLMILKYIGSYEDVIQTSFTLQDSGCNFITAENTTRKKELERILKIDFINELIKRGTSILQEERAIYKHLEQKCPIDEAAETKRTIDELTIKLKELDINLNKLKKNIDVKNKELGSLKEKLIPVEPNEEFEEMDNKESQDQITKQLSDLNTKVNEFETKFKTELKVSDYNNMKKWKKKWKSGKEKHQEWKSTRDNELEKIDTEIEEYYSELENVDDTISKNNEKIKKIILKIDKNRLLIEKNKIKEIREFNESDNTDTSDTSDTSDVSNINNSNGLNIDDYIEKRRSEVESLKEKLIQIKSNNLPAEFIDLLGGSNLKSLETKCFDEWNNVILEETGLEFFNKKYDKFKKYMSDYHVYDFLNVNNQKINNDKNTISLIEQNIEEINSDITRLRKVRKTIYALRNENEILKKEIETLNSEKETFEKELVELEKKKINNKTINSKIKECKLNKKKLLKKSDKKYNELEKTIQSLEEYWELCHDKEELMKLLNDKDNTKQKELEIWKESIKKNKLIQKDIDKLEEELSLLNKEYDNVNGELNVAKAKFVSNNTNLQTLLKDIKEMRKKENKTKLCELYIKALKQLPYILIEKVRPRLETLVNELLSVITDFQLKFEIENSKIDIYLNRPLYEGKLIILNNASGFEKFVSNLAIRLALLDVSLLPKPNFMAVDEGWLAFDSNNISNLRNIFDHLKSKFKFLIIISHLQAIKGDCNMQINLVKNKDGFSQIKFS